MAASAASAQAGEGEPSPSVQGASSPAAARMRAMSASVPAEQASSRAPSASWRKRSENGVSTGRGALIASVTARPAGAWRESWDSSSCLSAAVSVLAVTVTRSALIETLDRGSARTAARPNRSARSQPSGAAWAAVSSMSERFSASDFSESVTAARPLSGTSPMSEMACPPRRISSA